MAAEEAGWTKGYPEVGTRVTTRKVVDRCREATIEVGEGGVVDRVLNDQIHVMLDKPHRHLKDWDNCVIWWASESKGGLEGMLDEFWGDMEVEEPTHVPGI